MVNHLFRQLRSYAELLQILGKATRDEARHNAKLLSLEEEEQHSDLLALCLLNVEGKFRLEYPFGCKMVWVRMQDDAALEPVEKRVDLASA